jgi:hypothetical protein
MKALQMIISALVVGLLLSNIIVALMCGILAARPWARPLCRYSALATGFVALLLAAVSLGAYPLVRGTEGEFGVLAGISAAMAVAAELVVLLALLRWRVRAGPKG